MVKINTLFKKQRIEKIKEFELNRYINFFKNSYKDNLEHSQKVIADFPRWSVISGYYAMHDIKKTMGHRILKDAVCKAPCFWDDQKLKSEAYDHIINYVVLISDITKLLFAKKFGLKVNSKVHKTTIDLLKELIKNKEISNLLVMGYNNFINLASDLEEAKKQRTKMQYYTGTDFLKQEYSKLAVDFNSQIVLPFINKIRGVING